MVWLIDGNNSKGFWRSRPCLVADAVDDLDEDSSPIEAERRLMQVYLTDLNRWGILALVRTAPESQARVLGEFFQKHLCARSSIGVSFASEGPEMFTLEFHLPLRFDECEDAQDKVMRYQYHVEEGMEVDPLSRGKDDVNMPIWHLRAYFLRIMGIRLEQVRDEWELIRKNLHNGIVSFMSHGKEGNVLYDIPILDWAGPEQ
ncbi:hypothetical protein K4K58_000533 [Colletotrichum sp. SAR11_239]|nr:hypothetical protein K4K58_000533 [Colletotrichum sp. SAR11_239]